MKISYNWLKEIVSIKISPEETANLLTRSGLEVENVEVFESVRGSLKGIVIGEVVSCKKHPEADKLSLTEVHIGSGVVSPIVCGAPNVATGQKVLVATTGTTLYPTNGDSFTIKKAKIRGAVSEGMICAEDEMGMGASHDGILVLETDLPAGTPASDFFKLETDYVFEIGLTPNRADAASHLGVARDLKVLLEEDINLPDVANFAVNSTETQIEVKVENAIACPRYSGVMLSGVEVKESPDWLKTRLKSIGVAPLNNVVDITNYVLHELGQPLHAFDAEKISGRRVIVKNLPEGTSFTTLDDKERKLKAHDLMICDDKGGMCIAGVFGGKDSGITHQTSTIFLESAFFSADSIRKTALAHGLKTDASFRFERGTDPAITLLALKRAALMITEIAGGTVSSEIIDIYPEKIQPFTIEVSFKNVARLIGQNLEKDFIKKTLKNLDIEMVNENPEGFTAIVPSYRVDVQREADIIEELLRIYGYDNIDITSSLKTDYLADFPSLDKDKIQNETSTLLASIGFQEIITNSLTKPVYAEKAEFINSDENVTILNKLSEDLAVLRQSLLFSGLEVIAHNNNRRQSDLKLFEFGKTYSKRNEKFVEEVFLSLFITGDVEEESWLQKSKKADFHDLYSVIQKILFRFNVNDFKTENVEDPLYYYGLEIFDNKSSLVKLGKVKKDHLKYAEVKQDVFYAEVKWEKLLKRKNKTLVVEEISKFPEVRRDLSLVINKKVTFEEIKNTAGLVESGLINAMNVFDVYEGEAIGTENKAYAISFILQDKEKTLTDKIIDKTMQKIMSSFEQKLGAKIRK